MKIEIDLNDQILDSLATCEKYMKLSRRQIIEMALTLFLVNLKKGLDFANIAKTNFENGIEESKEKH